MIFEHIKLDSLDFDLKSETQDNGKRQYVTPSGVSYPSVTTVLSSYSKAGIAKWRARVGEVEANKISSQASRRGTSLHTVCEKFLLNELTDLKMQSMMPMTKELFLQVKGLLSEHIGKIYCLEQALYSDKLKVAGRVDCIAEWKGKLSVIDFKSSSKLKTKGYIKNYFMQCSAYAEMFGEITGMPIEDIVVAIAVENEGKPQIFEEKKHGYLEELNSYIMNYENK